jgi:hypothetical protein
VGGTVFFPTATYKTTATLVIAHHNAILYGNNSVIAYYGATGAAIDGSSTVRSGNSYPDGVLIQDLTVNH